MDTKEEIIQKLSEKYCLPVSDIRRAVDSQFKFTANTIREGKFHSVRLPYFGVFKPNLKRKKHLDGKAED